MTIYEAMTSRGLSCSKLTRLSGIPDSTLRDVLNGETSLRNCRAITVSKLATALHMPVESVIQLEAPVRIRSNKQNNTFHDLTDYDSYVLLRKSMLDILFNCGAMILYKAVLKDKTVEWYYKDRQYLCALWLMGLMDYLGDRQGLTRITQYDRYRGDMMKRPVYPNNRRKYVAWEKDEARRLYHAIPQFLRYGIIETEDTIKQY